MRAEQIAPRDYPYYRSWRRTGDDGKPADAFEHHVIGGIAQRIVLEDDSRSSRKHGAEQLLTGVGAIDQVAPGDDTD